MIEFGWLAVASLQASYISYSLPFQLDWRIRPSAVTGTEPKPRFLPENRNRNFPRLLNGFFLCSFSLFNNISLP